MFSFLSYFVIWIENILNWLKRSAIHFQVDGWIKFSDNFIFLLSESLKKGIFECHAKALYHTRAIVHTCNFNGFSIKCPFSVQIHLQGYEHKLCPSLALILSVKEYHYNIYIVILGWIWYFNKLHYIICQGQLIKLNVDCLVTRSIGAIWQGISKVEFA